MTQNISSVGPMWPPEYEERNDRVKGFHLSVVNNVRDFVSVIDHAQNLQLNYDASRLTVRMIVGAGNSYVDGKKAIEATIPLDGRWNGHTLIYCGMNTQQRYVAHEAMNIAEEEKSIVDKFIQYAEVKSKSEILGCIEKERVVLQLLKNPTPSDIENLVDLYSKTYRTFSIPLDTNGVTHLVNNPNNLVGIIREPHTRRIVSVGVAERHYEKIQCKNGEQEFRFAELSDAATHPEYEKRSFYTAIGFSLLELLKHEDFDLVYGEARACIPGVNKACRQMGRTYYGSLPKHCSIDGGREVDEQGPYENLNVWAITHDPLQNIFRQEETWQKKIISRE